MVQESFQRRQQVDALDKVEPYGANAEARASSETSNLLARTTAQFTRLLGDHSEKMAVKKAKKKAFDVDPETGMPMMPETMMIGGIRAVDAYQKTLGQRYEKSIADSFQTKLLEAQTKHLDNEEGFRQDMAIQVGAMADKVHADYKTMFTEMASNGVSEVAGKIAYRNAQREAAAARAAARANATRAANMRKREEVLQGTSPEVFMAYKSAWLDSDAARDLMEREPAVAMAHANRYAEEQVLSMAKYNLKANGVNAYPEVEAAGMPTPELTDMSADIEAVENHPNPQFNAFGLPRVNETADMAELPTRELEIPGTRPDVANQEATSRAIQRSTVGEDGGPAATLIPPDQTEQFLPKDVPYIGGFTAEQTSGRVATTFNDMNAKGEFNQEAWAKYESAKRMSGLPDGIAAAEWASMTDTQRGDITSGVLPGSQNIEWWADPDNVDAAKNDPVANGVIRMVERGLLPPALKNYFDAALNTDFTMDPDQAENAAYLWKMYRTEPGLDNSWANQNPELAGTLDAIVLTTNAMPPSISEDNRIRIIEQVRQNGLSNDYNEMAVSLGLEDVGEYAYSAVRNEVTRLLHAEVGERGLKGSRFSRGIAAGLAGGFSEGYGTSFGLGRRDFEQVPAFDPAHVPDFVSRVIAATKAMKTGNVADVLDFHLEQALYEVEGFVDQTGARVGGVLRGDYPQVVTTLGENPVDVTRAVAAGVLRSTGLNIDPTNTNELQLRPVDGGYDILNAGEDTGLSIGEAEIQHFITAYEARFFAGATDEFSELNANKIMLMEELQSGMMMNVANDEELQEIHDKKREEVRELELRMRAISNHSTVDYINSMPPSAFNGFIKTGL